MIDLVSRIAALLLLIALVPLLLVLWSVCLAVHGRPVMFSQYRAGKATVPFELLKFRSMRDLRDPGGQPLPDAQRITALGKFLRRTRLDELPGLLNIVRGEMTWVGPRPLLPSTISDLGLRGRRRCAVKPGLTGWSQVNGNTLLSLDQKVELDLWYIDNRGPLLDLKILALTLLVVVAGEKVRVGAA
ncbi:sugar transferase [Erythrobacter sp.]|uniref:sugar transferase n=1 Tax=Erythrobacter sp. TaxID=1042 RepID=UPI002EB3694A|nr:sugar transferase [Erythrobacter sp.]